MVLASVRRRFLLLALALPLVFAASASAQPRSSIAGRVTDSATGRPVAGVQVSLYSLAGGVSETSHAFTDGAGGFRFDGLAPGEYHVVAHSSAGYLGELSDGTPCYGGLVFLEPRGYLCGDREVPPPPRIAVAAGANVEVDFDLDLGGVIAGRVTSAATGEPLADVRVHATDPVARESGRAETAADGRFRITSLPAGRYWVTTATFGPLADEVWDGVHCDGRGLLPGRCDPRGGRRVTVVLRGQVGGIDFALERLGAITGRVTAAESGEGLAGIQVLAQRDDGANAGGVTGPGGEYRLGGLLAGDYRVYAYAEDDRVDQVWDGVDCASLFCGTAAGTPVAVAIDQEAGGIDFDLEIGGSLSGSVTSEESGAPIPGVTLLLRGALGFQAATSDAAGRYRIAGLPGGAYRLYTINAAAAGTADEAFDGVPCGLEIEGCHELGIDLPLTLGEEITGIDLSLELLGAIEGRVTDDETGVPIPGTPLVIRDGRGFVFALAGSDGRYLAALPRGRMIVETQAWAAGLEYVDERYDGVQCFLGRCDPSSGTPVTVRSGAVTGGIDLLLRLGAAIEGRVVREEDGAPVQATLVQAFDDAGRFVDAELVGSDGRYRIGGLLDGDYRLMTSGLSGVVNEVYDRIQCVPVTGLGCDPLEGAPVRAEADRPPRQADFALAPGFRPGTPCRRGPTRLCLSGGRFEVGVHRRAGSFGVLARARPISDSAGAFTFFADDNVEAVARVIDACAGFDRFWAFSASLSGLGVEAGVRDTVTGEARFYTELGGGPALDTEAFDTCAAAAPATSPVTARSAPAPGAAGAGSCLPDATTLCLLDGRFAVEAEWDDGAGGSGAAGAVPLGDRSGYLWFHREGSPEVAVKILDACGLDPPAFWLFASGLTTSEVFLTVTDTAALEQRTYFNPLGQVFLPIRDTQAFGSCP